MGNRPTSPSAGPPSLASLFISFVSIGMMSFGGGLAAWTRREVVQRRGWLDDKQFLSGYALSQLVPAPPTSTSRCSSAPRCAAPPGAVACFCGLTALPVAIVLLRWARCISTARATLAAPGSACALGGMGAVAIGLNLGTGVRLARRNISGLIPIVITAIVALSIGVLGFSLVHVLLVMMPVSLLAAWLTRPR